MSTSERCVVIASVDHDGFYLAVSETLGVRWTNDLAAAIGFMVDSFAVDFALASGLKVGRFVTPYMAIERAAPAATVTNLVTNRIRRAKIFRDDGRVEVLG